MSSSIYIKLLNFLDQLDPDIFLISKPNFDDELHVHWEINYANEIKPHRAGNPQQTKYF